MERIILVNSVILCIVVFYFGIVLAVPHNYEILRDEDKNDKDKESYLWYGHRLNRRKQGQINDETYKNPEAEQLVTLMDAVQDSPWAILAFSKGKRHTVSFTPRLGRESEELNNPSDDQSPEVYAELLRQRSPPFAPRLGRRFSPYLPRLGRENDKS